MSRQTPSDERGQATAFYVAIMVLIFCFMALAFDIGFLFHARRVAQNAADPAALAGAAARQGCALAGVSDPAVLANDYAIRNLHGKTFQAGSDQITVDAGSTWNGFPSVYARVTRPQAFIFARFLGLTSSDVPAEAEAVCGPIQEGDVCPMFVAGDPSLGVQRDASGNVISAYGIIVGQVFAMKDAPGHIGAFRADAAENNGTNGWRDFLAAGCVGDDGETAELCEGCSVENKPGNWGNPAVTGLEGGNGANSAGLYEVELDYEDVFGNPDLFPHGHLDCDLQLNISASDPSIVLSVENYSNGVPMGVSLTPATLVTAINAKTNPADMLAGGPPCGGIRKDGSKVEGLVTKSVQGRFIHIVMTDGSCTSACDLDVLGIMRMYVVCWTNQEADGGNIPAASRYVPDGGPNDTTFYGVFADFKAPSVLGGGGLGTNPLAPKHVALVK
jgi:Putative Flp pilus-assembly TadE/G-like